MKKAITIKDIAEQLNLSRNTVAKALNGQYVPEKTRRQVLEKAKELNYKSLNSQTFEKAEKPYRILLVSGKPLNNMDYFIPLIKGIENFCFERHYELFQYTFNKDRTPFSSFSDHVKSLNLDGIVAIECFDKSFVERLLNLDIPICFNDFTTADVSTDKRFDVIGTNDEASVCNMIKRLHKKYKLSHYTFVGDNSHCLSFYERYAGMLKGISLVKGTHTRREDIRSSDESFDYGSPAALKTEILKLPYKPDCFICCNDYVARSVCKALATLNIKVPQNALVVGFDNVAEAISISPKITSFAVEREFLGIETMNTLILRIKNPSIPSKTLTVNATPILRESTERY